MTLNDLPNDLKWLLSELKKWLSNWPQNNLKWFQWPQMTWNDLKWLEMASNEFKWPKMTSKDLQMTPNDLKQPQIAILKCKMDTHQLPLKVGESYMYVYLILESSCQMHFAH